MPGAKEAVLACNQANWLVFVVTNQAGIAKGLYTEADMHVLHAHMQTELAHMGAHIDAFAFYPHHPEGVVPQLRQTCLCRKPAPGMLLRLCREWPVDVARSIMLGDRPSDREAARAAGVKDILFSGGNLRDVVVPLLEC